MENGVGYADQAMKTDKPGNVSALLDQLAAVQSELSDAVAMLRNHLEGVLRPAEPQQATDQPDRQASSAYRSGVADVLAARIEHDGDTLNRVRDLLGRLDL